ncbi:MAG: M28 family peptidase [Thermoanaerobaculia bacterium]
MKNKDSRLSPSTIARAVAAAFLACGLAACQAPAPAPDEPVTEAPPPLSAAVEQAAASIDQPLLAEFVSRLASDEFEGRGPASPGDEKARAYLAQTMEAMGLEPGGPDAGWQQPFELVGITSELPDTWKFVAEDGELQVKYWNEYIATSGVQAETAKITDAEVVFVGYGIEAPEHDWDDYKGADLAGKVLLMLNNDPDWDPALFEGNRRLYYGRWDYKYASAARQGAAGAIIIHTTPSAGYPWQVVQSSWGGENFELPAGPEPRVQVQAWLTEDAANALVALAGHDLDSLVESAHGRDFTPVPLGIETSLALSNTVQHKETANVAGLLRGSDPELADQVVVYTAHHDHFGIREPDESGDNIYNGALDNASGCSQVLAIAQAFTKLPQPPRRSLLFLFVGVEEQGLLGSEYFARNPTVPPGKIAANVNVDGANIWGRATDLAYIGYGKSSLDRVVETAAAQQGRLVKGEQFPDRGSFYRSDQFNFAKIGVPAIYLDTGADFVDRPEGWAKEQIEAWEKTHYHQPNDEFDDSWNFDGVIDDTRLAFAAGLAIANADEMPSWKPGDEFEAARKAALAALAD